MGCVCVCDGKWGGGSGQPHERQWSSLAQVRPLCQRARASTG